MDDDKKKAETSKVVEEVETSINAIRKLHGKAPIFESESQKDIIPEPPCCSFCGKGKNQVKHMLQGINAYICDQCITLCHEIINAAESTGSGSIDPH